MVPIIIIEVKVIVRLGFGLTADMLIDNNLLAYINRNILGQKLSPNEEKLLSKMDRMAAELKSADIVVVAFPMYNFSMPAIVKALFDSVMQK